MKHTMHIAPGGYSIAWKFAVALCGTKTRHSCRTSDAAHTNIARRLADWEVCSACEREERRRQRKRKPRTAPTVVPDLVEELRRNDSLLTDQTPQAPEEDP